MKVLHGAWHPGQRTFQIWAEDTPPSRRGRAASGTGLRKHPFAVQADALREWTVSEETPGSLILRLPAIDGRPLPSPELVRTLGLAPAEGEPVLAPFQVPALGLPPAGALRWLAEPPAGDLMAGSDLRFWRTAARFALGLLRRERWLPVLETSASGKAAARWVPALNQPEDAARFRGLCEAMPPVCRAQASEGEGTYPGRQALLRSFLAATMDAAIRSWSDVRLPGDAEAVQDCWVAALLREAPEVRERAENLRPLAAALRTWLEPVRGMEAGFRTCFRLDPPPLEAADVEPWILSFWLQAVDEPSLLVPAAEVWERGREGLSAAGRRWEAPQERMLPALARAGRLFPPIAVALKQPAPTGCTLTTSEAYQFLREVAPLLEETGNGVLLPDWWRKPAARLGIRARLRSASGSTAAGSRKLMTQEHLVQFDWQLALGDEPLSPEEFAELASLKEPLVRIRGRWLEIRPDEVERAIRAWERRRNAGPVSLLDALHLPEEEEGLPVTGVEFEGELEHLFRRLQGEERLDPVPLPPEFQGHLRPYQQYGLEWLTFLRHWGLGACLADDMGLGKTVQVLAYLLHLSREGREGPALLICPTSLVENWRREASRFAPTLRVYIHHGANRVRDAEDASDAGGDVPSEGKEDLAADPAQAGEGVAGEPGLRLAAAVAGYDLVVTTYPLALRDQGSLRTVAWGTVILDEAQNIKNPAARQTRAIRSLSSGARVAMTGTPVENRLGDLWSLMEFLNPGILGSERSFRGRYAIPIERHHEPEAAEKLRRLTGPFILRRVKTDPTVIRDLPEKQEMKVICTLTSEQATLYEAVVREMLEAIEESEGIQRRGLVLSVLSRLKQICNHPAHFLHDESALAGRSGKLERLVEMLEEVLSVGEAALVFTQFAEMGELLQRHLQTTLGREALFLHGGVPRPRRDGIVNRFQAEDGPPVMVLSLKAGGVGLNLTRANHVFHFDRWWNPAVENQATDRAFRIGQKRNVQVHKFLCAGTLEDQIDAMIEQKQELAQSIVGTGENWLTELSTVQLRDLLTLRRAES